MSTDPFKCSCFVSLNIVMAIYAGMLSRCVSEGYLWRHCRPSCWGWSCAPESSSAAAWEALWKKSTASPTWTLPGGRRWFLPCVVGIFFWRIFSRLHLLSQNGTSKASTWWHYYLKCSLANSLMLTGIIISSTSLELRIADLFFWPELSSSWLVRDSCCHKPQD